MAEKRKVSLTAAVIEALEARLKLENTQSPLANRLAELAGQLATKAEPGGHEMTKDETDEMWGHS